jgi:hypothetical protein
LIGALKALTPDRVSCSLDRRVLWTFEAATFSILCAAPVEIYLCAVWIVTHDICCIVPQQKEFWASVRRASAFHCRASLQVIVYRASYVAARNKL